MADLKVAITTDDEFRKYMEDSTTYVSTTKEGILSIVIEFAPGTRPAGDAWAKLSGLLQKTHIASNLDTRKANGKLFYEGTNGEVGCRLSFIGTNEEELNIENSNIKG